MQCTNCGNTNPTLLGHIDKTADLITSDAQMLRVEKAWRFFCNQCGCIFALFLPPDMLRQYFSSQYSLSASVQNNIIVDEERVLSRRDKLFPLLFGTLDKIGPDK